MSVESPKRSRRARHARSTSASIWAWSVISPSASASSQLINGGMAADYDERERRSVAGRGSRRGLSRRCRRGGDLIGAAMAGASGCICVDGRLLAPHEASVSALDAGFMLGDGLFESLRASGGVPYLLERHLERLYGGAGELGFEGMPTRELLTEQIGATLARAGLDDTYLRITVTRGRGGAPPAPPSGSPTVVIAALPAPPV